MGVAEAPGAVGLAGVPEVEEVVVVQEVEAVAEEAAEEAAEAVSRLEQYRTRSMRRSATMPEHRHTQSCSSGWSDRSHRGS